MKKRVIVRFNLEDREDIYALPNFIHVWQYPFMESGHDPNEHGMIKTINANIHFYDNYNIGESGG
jgi:hypothetical protein